MSSFVLRKSRPRLDGRVSVTFSAYVNSKRIYHGTGISVRPEDWDEVKGQVRRTDVRYAKLNVQLAEFKARFEREYADLPSDAPPVLDNLRKKLSRRKLEKESHVPKEKTFWEQYRSFMNTKANDRTKRTMAKYVTLQKILEAFEKKYGMLTFEGINHTFGDNLSTYLTRVRKLTNNSKGKYVSTLKTFLSWAEDRGAPLSKDYRKFKVDEEDVDVIALTQDELERVKSVDLSTHPRLDRVRDLFLFACYTGARFGDVQNLNLDDVRRGTWHLRMGKTKSPTLIPIVRQAEAILDKYRHDGRLPSISSQRMNDYLKELGRMAELNEPVCIVRYLGAKRNEIRGPKWEHLTSHVARRTFVTLSLEAGMRPDVIMSITGHRSFKTMKKYIAITEQSKKDAMENVWGRV